MAHPPDAPRRHHEELWADLAPLIDAALARLRSDDPDQIAYLAACRATNDYEPALSVSADPEDYVADFERAQRGAVDEALRAAGYDPDEVDVYDAVWQAQAGATAATWVAYDGGGGGEESASAKAFAAAATSPKPAPTHIVVPLGCVGPRHRRAPGHRSVRRRGSRRTTGSRGDPDDGESEPSGVFPWRRPDHGLGNAAALERSGRR